MYAVKANPHFSLTDEYSVCLKHNAVRPNITLKLFIDMRLHVQVQTINWSGMRSDSNCDVLCRYHRGTATQCGSRTPG